MDYLVNLMKNIADQNDLSDVTLIAADDLREFPAHRLVLRASSKYFDALLGSNFRDGNEQNFVLPDIDGPTLETIVHYIYHGDITIDEQNVDAIIDAATSMQLIDLENRCVDFKSDNLNTLNCVDTLLIADKYQFTELKSKAFNMICADYEKIPNEHIAGIDETTIRELLKSDQLSSNESAIFSGLIYWLSSNNINESDSIVGFLDLIRLRHIQTRFLVDTVEPFFVQHNQRERISDEYRNRALHPNAKIGLRRYIPENIHLVSYSTGLQITKYNHCTNDWIEIKTIRLQSTRSSAIVAKDMLYFMDDTVACAYNLDDFSRSALPRMNKSRWHPLLVVAEDFIYVFGGSVPNFPPGIDVNDCERFDIGNQVWTTRNNMPIRAQSHNMNAIEHDGLIHVAIDRDNHTGLYCHNLVNDTWLLKLTIPNRAVFAKTSSSLYVIENSSILHRYDPTDGVLTRIGHFNFKFTVLRTIDLNDEIYLLGSNSFGKVDLRENVKVVDLIHGDFTNSLCMYVK